MDLQELYRETILDHSRRPRLAGLREPFDAEVHQVNPICGDEVTLRLQLGRAADGTEDGAAGGARTLEDVSYDAVGCSISQASASVMVEALTGRTVDEAARAYQAFHAIVTSGGRGDSTMDPMERLDADLAEAMGDAPAFAGVARYPARVKCALLGWTALRQALVQAG